MSKYRRSVTHVWLPFVAAPISETATRSDTHFSLAFAAASRSTPATKMLRLLWRCLRMSEFWLDDRTSADLSFFDAFSTSLARASFWFWSSPDSSAQLFFLFSYDTDNSGTIREWNPNDHVSEPGASFRGWPSGWHFSFFWKVDLKSQLLCLNFRISSPISARLLGYFFFPVVRW